MDPNQSLTPDLLAEILEGARRDGVPLEAVEEPFPKRRWDLLARARPPCPLLLDESIQTSRDARTAYRRESVSGANIKLAKSGVLRSLAIVDETRAARGRRARLMIGCMAESRLGLSAAVHFALGTGVFDFADLDSDLILRPTPYRGGYSARSVDPFAASPGRAWGFHELAVGFGRGVGLDRVGVGRPPGAPPRPVPLPSRPFLVLRPAHGGGSLRFFPEASPLYTLLGRYALPFAWRSF